MQIQLCGRAVWRWVATVPRSARHDTMCREVGSCEKVPRTAWLKQLRDEIYSVARRTSPQRTARRGSFELERSCRSREHRWRTEWDFRSWNPFDNPHWPTALGTEPDRLCRPRWRKTFARLEVPHRVADSKVARWRHVVGWPESRSDRCARNLWEVRATGSGAKTHREDKVSNFCSLL